MACFFNQPHTELDQISCFFLRNTEVLAEPLNICLHKRMINYELSGNTHEASQCENVWMQYACPHASIYPIHIPFHMDSSVDYCKEVLHSRGDPSAQREMR